MTLKHVSGSGWWLLPSSPRVQNGLGLKFGRQLCNLTARCPVVFLLFSSIKKDFSEPHELKVNSELATSETFVRFGSRTPVSIRAVYGIPS